MCCSFSNVTVKLALKSIVFLNEITDELAPFYGPWCILIGKYILYNLHLCTLLLFAFVFMLSSC